MIKRRHGRLRVLVLVVVVLGLAGFVAAQDGSPDFWGLGTNFHFVNANEFASYDNANLVWRHDNVGFWHAYVGAGAVYATVRLPTGALVTGMTVIYYDNDGSDDFSISLRSHWVTVAGVSGETIISPTFASSGTPGTSAFWVDIDPDHTIQYIVDGSTAQSYCLTAYMPSSLVVSLRGVIIGWNRQVSPAPATATFGDVGTGHWAFPFVEALAASGITGGCGGGNYCPDNPITRAEMAVFLSGALGLHWAP